MTYRSGLVGGRAYDSSVVRFSTVLLTSMTLGSLVGVITAAGEEIGWRGFMVSRLVEAGIPFPLVASGIIWGLWHVPGISVFWGNIRLQTGSVWGAVLGHSAWNAVIECPFTSYTRGTNVALWVGESGIILVVVVLVLTGLWAKSRTAQGVTRPSAPRRIQ